MVQSDLFFVFADFWLVKHLDFVKKIHGPPASNKRARLEGNVDEAALEVNLVQCLFPQNELRMGGFFPKWRFPKMGVPKNGCIVNVYNGQPIYK